MNAGVTCVTARNEGSSDNRNNDSPDSQEQICSHTSALWERSDIQSILQGRVVESWGLLGSVNL
jgi:hypothetical protein